VTIPLTAVPAQQMRTVRSQQERYTALTLKLWLTPIAQQKEHCSDLPGPSPRCWLRSKVITRRSSLLSRLSPSEKIPFRRSGRLQAREARSCPRHTGCIRNTKDGVTQRYPRGTTRLHVPPTSGYTDRLRAPFFFHSNNHRECDVQAFYRVLPRTNSQRNAN